MILDGNDEICELISAFVACKDVCMHNILRLGRSQEYYCEIFYEIGVTPTFTPLFLLASSALQLLNHFGNILSTNARQRQIAMSEGK